MACTYIYEGKKYNAWEFADVLASMPIDDLVKYLPGAVAAQLSEATQASRLGYDVQARKKAYTDDRQLQLFLDSKPDPSQTGPASDRARREAVATVDDLRSTGTVLGQSLSSDYAARQRVSLVGQKVSDSEGLAILAQVYRDPRFETFRLVFTDDSGNVVSQVGLTSRLPASATALIGDDLDAYLKDIAAAAKSTGATGFYMLHNHPSGLSKPSSADVSLTKMFAASMPGIAFQSHVVIDTNEYSVIDRDGYASTEKKDFGQPKPFQDAEWGGLKIEGPADVMAMAKKLQVDDGAITLIHTNAQNQVKSITTIPESVAAGKRAAQHIARAALGQNGANLFAVGRSAAALGNIGGLVTDSILVSADGTVQSLRASGAIRGGNIYPARRTPRVSPDTSAAFDYLRMPTQGGKQSSRGVAESQPEPYDQYGDPSPEEASTVEAGIQGKSPIEVAKWLEENAPRQYAIIAAKVREKLESLAGIGVDFGMEIVNVGDYAHAGLSRARGVTYPYSVDGKTRIVVAINGKDMTGRVGMSYKTVLHELVHAATSQSIQLGLSGNKNFVQPVKDLIDVMMQIGERVSKNIANGSASEFELSLADGRRNMMQSPDEVLAWALSSSEAQAYLESIEHQGKSLWSRFVDAVRSALGLSTGANTSLSEVLRISEILLKPSGIAEILGVKTDANYSIDAKPFSFDGIPRAQQQAAGNKHVLPDHTKPDIVWSSQAIPDTITIDGTNPDIRFSRSGGQSGGQQGQTPVPPEETRFQAAQRKAQDKLNRFTVIKEWLAEQGITLSELADVHKTEERMHSRFANKAEDFREKRVKPLVEKIQKAGFSMDDVARFLHAQHAKERNDQIAKVNKNMPDGGSGMTNAEAAAILAASSPELAALANELRSITVDTKNILLNSGLISKDVADAWDGAYQHYVPLKGGPDDEAGGKGTGKGLSVREKQRRALGHEAREDDTREDGEWIIENILGDHERALMQAEKNRVFQALLKMAIETSPLNLITINKPEKRQILKNQASYVVRVKGRPVESFTTKEAANLFKQAVALSQKGVSPADITIEKTYDQTVALMASPMPGPDEATGYVNGQLVRVQFNDDLLARAYNNMGAESLGKILQAGRALNNYFSKIYTGYNPEFLLVNVIRDFQTGLANTTGEEGIGMAMKAAKNYVMRFRELFRYARTGNETRWVKMYREDGGNTGAAYLSDLERLGSEIQTEYKAFQGVAANLKNRDYKGAARAAMRKVFDRTLVYIEHVNQAGENAMRLAVYQAMIESGRSRREAASLAKNVTVNFNRKGELGAQANALYLFFNASVQGTAAVAHAHFKGKHRAQAWGFSSAIIGMGYLLSLLAAEADEEEYEKTSEYERSRNILIPTGDGFVKIPVAFGYGFFWNFGRGMSDAQRTSDLGKTPWHIASSFVEEFTPFGAMAAGSGPDSEQAALYALPTIGQIAFSPIYNRTSMGIPMMPSSFNEHARARDLMNRNTRGTWADDLAGLLEDAGMDVSPETLKHYGRTFTGGAGMFVSSTVDGVKLKAQGAELDAREIPFYRKLYTAPDVRGARARYHEAKSEADKALSDFKRAVKQGDMETANEIQAEKGELLALARLASSQKKRIKAARDRIDSIRLSGEYGKAAERHIIKNMEAEEEKIYDNYMAIFKAQTGR